MKHTSEEQLILYYYDEAHDSREIEEHLAICTSCRSDYEAIGRLFAAVDASETPEREQDYETQVWRRLQPRLAARRKTTWSFLLHPPRWAAAGATAALVLAAFLLGRLGREPQVQVTAPAPEQVRERLLLASVADHLERTQRFLMELINAGGEGSVDISPQQDAAEELLATNRLYRQSAERAGEAGMASVLDDLERTLLEIAHSPAWITSAELDQIRQRIDEQGILFKIRVIGSQVREREKAAARELTRRIS